MIERDVKMSDSANFEKMDLFYLGRELDPETGKTSSVPLLYKNKNLTTHAAIIGMTGSGKTGLGIGLLEEAALDRLPAIVIDPKGDMGNLMLTFPDLSPDEFLPWIDASEAEQKGLTREELSRQTAENWEKGINSWGQDRERLARLKNNVDITIYTPGSSAGRPVSVLDSFDAPKPDVVEDNDTVSSLVNSAVSSLLGLIGVKADPLKSREHILLSSIILYHWRRQDNLSLKTLITNVVNPPLDRIGVFPLDSFYPQEKRMELAMQLNNILASPAFSGWTKGEPLEVESMFYTASGIPRISIFSIAHLNDSERMFFVTMLLGRLISWMRQQEGASGLRCLLYMDEIFGYFPPSANPPSKKPMLLLLKQARAYGLGVILATQNPVDLDYKGLSNIGTWFVGRLQTKQDQDRVLSGISGSSKKLDSSVIRQLLANMRGRTFLMSSVHLDEPVLFETRWVLSYLKGPISLNEVSKLVQPTNGVSAKRDEVRPVEVETGGKGSFSTGSPLLPDTVEQHYLLPPVPMDDLKYIPWLAGSATVRFYNQSRGIDQVKNINRRIPLAAASGNDWDMAVDNPVSVEETVTAPPAGSSFMELPVNFSKYKNLREQSKNLSDHLYQTMRLSLKRVPSLKLESRPGESDNQFYARLVDHLRAKKEAEVEKIEQRYKTKQQSLERRLEKACQKIDKEKGDVMAKGMDTAVSFGMAVFGALLGRKALSVSTASRSARGVRSAGRLMKEKKDVRRAEEDVQQVETEIGDLAAELQEKTAVLAVQYDPENFPVEEFSIKPRRADIYDVKVFVQWEPKLNLTEIA
jgi:hypothetical protein